jgi:carboxymethylenebutenolidase
MVKKISSALLLFFGLSLLLLSVVYSSKSVYAQTNSMLTTTTTTTTTTVPSSDIDSSIEVGLKNSSVNYHDEKSVGYLVYPTNDTNQKLPAVIMIHEWWGLNDNIKNMANMLAKEGYVVLAVDLYNGTVATDSSSAIEFSSSVGNNPSAAIANMQSAVSYLSSLENVNASRIASLGWCFGGGQSLQLALNSEDRPLAATIIYYGNLVNDTQALSKIKWPVLGIFGDQDQSIPVNSVKQFEQALNKIGVTNEIYIYPGVGHAFANPSNANYAPKETADAWQKTIAFLDKYV